MSQATYANTTSDELLCRARDLQSVPFDDCRLGIVRMADLFMIRDWSVIDALRITDDDEVEAAFSHLAPGDAKSVIVRGRGSEEREVGCYVSVFGAMKMALSRPSVSRPGSAAHALLLWLTHQAAAKQQPKRNLRHLRGSPAPSRYRRRTDHRRAAIAALNSGTAVTKVRIPPRAPAVRFTVDPGDVPPEKVARRLHLTMEQFRQVLPRLLQRGFPAQDPDTGMFDLEAVDRWRHGRHKHLFPELHSDGKSEGPEVRSPGKESIFVERFKQYQARRKFELLSRRTAKWISENVGEDVLKLALEHGYDLTKPKGQREIFPWAPRRR